MSPTLAGNLTKLLERSDSARYFIGTPSLVAMSLRSRDRAGRDHRKTAGQDVVSPSVASHSHCGCSIALGP